MSIAQRDPLVEYQREAFNMFNDLQDRVQEQAARAIFTVQPAVARQPVRRQTQEIHASAGGDAPDPGAQTVRKVSKIGRNDPCWCGSGKKYKNCHWKEDRAK